MKKAIAFLLICSLSLIGAETKEKTLEELEAENKMLEMQLKNEKLKKEIEDAKKTDEQKKAEAIQQAKDIVAELTKEPSKDEKRSGRLWGIGIGGMAVTTSSTVYTPITSCSIYPYRCTTTNSKSQQESNDVLFLINTQLGGMTMWNRHFGVQYYSNLDTAFAFDFSKFSFIATFNSDAILNAYNSDSFGFGFLAGLGAGVRMDYATGGIWAYDFDMRANLGIRAIFGSRHALDFMLAIPFISTYDTSNLKENVSFSIRYTMGRF